MMSNYALIKNGSVENVVVWDGTGDLFSDYTAQVIADGEMVGPGFVAEQDSSGNWTFSAPVVVITPEEQAAINLQAAQSEYDRASDKITALNQQIEDEDYTGTTEDVVKASLTSWTTYRKALRAYISTGDGSATLPTAPTE
ncbi:hypothetical protein PUG81_04870 [Erwiniaceae bacterium L1_54_6]|jgi:hypothetical protein|nr:hypothetical protein [Erwiniaceae bacterium L1_54_6]